MIEIFNFAFGPYPQRVNIYLAEKQPEGVAVTFYAEPDRRANTPPPEIRALTPMGSLPILRDADGTVVGQSLAILEFIEDRIRFPDMRGSTPAERAKVRQFVHIFDEALTFFGLWARHGSALAKGVARSSQEVAEICAARYFAQLRIIENLMSEEGFLASGSVTLADCVAMATLQYARDFYSVPIPSECARLYAWFYRFSERPSAKRPPYPEEQRVTANGLMDQTGVRF
ncbi:Glutathione S-transferase [Rhizobium sp. RU33A]|uniref:glutathione S-transferase family protein n=1 Tax=Rhizobium sp. RU33A TaxID=1907413 RepID=UPI000955980E|nr:glutathione S-transferase family protein [Rhizobium sp. RU33A]SIQ86000.1 Glutathione S-transferase [Rhizobium sp. RU33A]